MINNIKYIKRAGIFLLALMLVSCNEFKEFESTTYGPGPTVTLAQVSVQDSTFTVSVTSSADGHASVILLPGSENELPGGEDLVTGNVEAMDYQSKGVRANTAVSFTFSGLVQNATFEVLAAANNGDGKVSEVTALAVGTDDTHAPMLVATEPEVGYDPVLTRDGTVVLEFDEAVMYDDTKDLTFYRYHLDTVSLAGSVEVDFNVVTITPADSLRYKEYIWLSYPEGAFTDYAGNPVEAMETHIDGGSFVGLYWRIESALFEAQSVSPEDSTLIGASSFDIEVTFEEGVGLTDELADGDITLTYDDGIDVLIKSVLVSEVSAAGNVLTVTASLAPLPGMSVTLNIPEGVLNVGIYNPNAEFSATWMAELSLADLAGNYGVAAASYGNPGVWDETWTATVELVPGNDTALSITIDAGNGGGLPFLAAVDLDSMTIKIAPGTPAGDLYLDGGGVSYGVMAIYSSDYYNFLSGTDIVVGTITGANTFTIDYLGMYNASGPWLWDAFNTSWTKTATKSAVSPGSITPSKHDRFK